MPISVRHLAILLAVALAACGAGGCAIDQRRLAAGIGDTIPQWIGGMPADGRPGAARRNMTST